MQILMHVTQRDVNYSLYVTGVWLERSSDGYHCCCGIVFLKENEERMVETNDLTHLMIKSCIIRTLIISLEG